MNRHFLRIIINTLVILTAFVFLGCQSKVVKDTIQRDLDDLQKQIFELQQDQAYINTKVEQTSTHLLYLNERLEKKEKELEDVIRNQEKLKQDLFKTKDAVEPEMLAPETRIEIEESQEMSGLSPTTKESRKSIAYESPTKLYNNALDLIRTGKIDNAIPLLQQYVEIYPRTELADNAQYWLGECYYKKRDFQNAINGFKKVLDDYPSGNKIPAALLKLGYSYYELRQITQALESLQRIINQYPNDPVYSLAQKKIDIILSER
ncbi:MAG: tol-pal system protein YbgF [bacterium]